MAKPNQSTVEATADDGEITATFAVSAETTSTVVSFTSPFPRKTGTPANTFKQKSDKKAKRKIDLVFIVIRGIG